VRLSFNQVVNAAASLTDEALGKKLSDSYEVVDAQHRTFPALASAREGSTVTETVWNLSDHIAQDVGSWVLANVERLAGCGAAVTESCAESFVARFAERAYRRPLSKEERASLLHVVSEAIATGSEPAEAMQYGAYAALSAPQFLYRSELGDDSQQPGPLTPSEVASELAFFLTDAPPDQPLLDAAANAELSGPEQVRAQATRLLQTPSARQNLQDALFSYFGLQNVATVVLETPDFTAPVRNSMGREAELLLQNNLWSSPLSALLTTRQSTIDAALAPVYAVAFPPPGVAPDAEGFAPVTVPAERAGLLTLPGFLTSRSRPDGPSVVARGLLVSATLLCVQNPPFPESIGDDLQHIPADLSTRSEREKAEYRAATAPCSTCHTAFDPYGLALGHFDELGRVVSADKQGRPIDASVTLPPLLGSVQVGSAAELAQVMASNPAFSSCITKNLLLYALAESPNTMAASRSLQLDGCALQALSARLAGKEPTFSDILIEIAGSATLLQRVAGQETP
jgi:hypothetical protein